MKKKIIALFIFLVLITDAFPDKMRIAVMDFKADGVSKSIARKISELIRSEMINTGEYTVIERSNMSDILKEQSFQQMVCTEVSCAVELGKLLSARKMLVGTIMKLGDKTIITGRIIDVEKGIGEFSQNQAVAGNGDLFSAITLFTKNLTARIKGETPVTTTITIPNKSSHPIKENNIYESSNDPQKTASVNGKYYDLIQKLNCPKDKKSYGTFRDWGFWSGTSWCKQKASPGYWVWVTPNWYIWRNKKK